MLSAASRRSSPNMIDQPVKRYVNIACGNIYIPHETFETYLKGIEAVALLPHNDGILIFPLIQESAGGLLLKMRNSQGDRIVHAQEFFRNNNYVEEFQERPCDVRWLSDRAALLIVGVPTAKNSNM
jgi:hypothetical protein